MNAPQAWSPGEIVKGVKFYSLMLLLFWIIAISISLGWNVFQTRKTMRLLAVKEARSHFNKDQAARFGSASHGGVGVSIPMAPYLNYEHKEVWKLAYSHLGIFLVGLLGLGLGHWKLNAAFNQRIEMEEKQKQIAGRLEALLSDMPVGIVIIDYETRTIVDANPHALSVFGCPLDKLVGKACTDHICPEQQNNCPVIDQGFRRDHSEREILTYDGQRVPVLKTVITTEVDDRKMLLECFIDITHKKNAEKEQLEKERLQVVLEMAGGVCHEFNQPLQIITGNCELLMVDKTLDKDTEKVLRTILDASSRMAALTGNLMNLTTYRTKPYLDSTIADFTSPPEIQPENISGHVAKVRPKDGPEKKSGEVDPDYDDEDPHIF